LGPAADFVWAMAFVFLVIILLLIGPFNSRFLCHLGVHEFRQIHVETDVRHLMKDPSRHLRDERCPSRVCRHCEGSKWWSRHLPVHEWSDSVPSEFACTTQRSCKHCGCLVLDPNHRLGEWCPGSACAESRSCVGGCGVLEQRQCCKWQDNWTSNGVCTERRDCANGCGAFEERTTHEWEYHSYTEDGPPGGWSYELCCGDMPQTKSAQTCRKCGSWTESES
jgi:hypothetical protein